METREPDTRAQEYLAALRELNRVGWARLTNADRTTINKWEGR